MRAISKCWCGAIESPNQASLLTLMSRAAAAEILDQSESFQALRRDQVPAVR
ncbi:MAG: hypothetical protein ACREWG_14725 [Gammaproteobacteria bacterium]